MEETNILGVYPLHRCKTLHLVRHAQGIHNVAGEKDYAAYSSEESFDAHLTTLGWQQVDNLRKHVQETGLSNKIDLVIVSPLLRAIQTAVGVFGGEGPNQGIDDEPPLMVADAAESHHPEISSRNCPPFVAVELCRERFGLHPCDRRRSISEYRPLFPAIDFSLIESDEDILWGAKARENIEEVEGRGRDFLNWLWSRKEKEIAIVTHKVFLHNAFTAFVKDYHPSLKTELCKQFSNCELRTVVIVDKRVIVWWDRILQRPTILGKSLVDLIFRVMLMKKQPNGPLLKHNQNLSFRVLHFLNGTLKVKAKQKTLKNPLMENFSYSSYPDSGDSSPHSREIDPENQTWDEPPSTNAIANINNGNNSNYKVKLMCSYGGKIQPRSHNNQLAYVGGDTKILAVDRNIKFSAIMSKLSSLHSGDSEVCFKYQLPGEDLDALITVTNDEDLDHMMLEYDRLHRASVKPARLRLFLFPANPPMVASGFGGSEPNSDRKWFVDELNSVQVQNIDCASAPIAVVPAANPDFLFGLDKVKLPDSVPAPATEVVQEVVLKDVTVGSDCGSEDRHLAAEPLLSPAEIQRQIHELQRMHIAATQEQQGILQRNIDESNTRAYNFQAHCKMSDKIVTSPAPGSAPLQMPAYFPDQHLTNAAYPAQMGHATDQQQVYLIPAAGIYQQPPTMRQVTGPTGQPYYGLQRVFQDVYREHLVYNPVPNSVIQAKGGVPESGYVQMAYDGTGRHVYYTVSPCQPMAQAPATALDQDDKVAVNAKVAPPQTSSV